MNDEKAYITVKKARIARSGRQIYTADEMKAQGITLKDNKEFGVVYRSPETLIKNKDKFANVPFVNDHPLENLTPDNWKDHAIGFVGSDIGVEVFDDEIWLTGDVVFYDRKAYEDYENGKVEISAGYDVEVAAVDNPDKVGYDAVLVDIPAVNHAALCNMARAGHNARVLDSLNFTGGNGMAKARNGLLGLLGIGKANDKGFKFSKVLMDSVEKIKTIKPEELQKEVDGVMSHVTSLGDSDERALLIGAVSDCYKNPADVLAKKDEVSAKIDALYAKCQDADIAFAAKILDGKKDDGNKDGEGDGKDKDGKEPEKKDGAAAKDQQVDIAKVIENAITKSVSSLYDSIDKRIDTAVQKALGIEEDTEGKGKNDQRSVTDSAAAAEDASYLVRGMFGSK